MAELRLGYADPPYLGCARLYPEHPEAHVWDRSESHAECMAKLDAEYDAWAFSLHEPSLRYLLPLAPQGVRVGVWVKPFASFKPGVDPAYTWEPVIYRTARSASREQLTCRDHLSANITLKKGLTGAKPDAFWFWLFELLGATPGDDFVDLFPGTGRGLAAWAEWSSDAEARHTTHRSSGRQLWFATRPTPGGDDA